MNTYTIEYVQSTNSYNVLRNGEHLVCTESCFENAYAVAEELHYEEECHEWARNNNQLCEFDMYGDNAFEGE